MKHLSKLSLIMLLGSSLIRCSGNTNKSNTDTISNQVKTAAIKEESNVPESVSVHAYFVYTDGSLSSFDILKDDNTLGEKPYEKIKIVLTGKYDNLTLKIKAGEATVLSKSNITLNGTKDFICDISGCDMIHIDLLKASVNIYQHVLNFVCGD